MKLIFLVLILACATAELANSLKDATQLEALKDNVVEDNVKEPNESLDNIEEDDSPIADEELVDSDDLEDDKSIDDEDRLEDPGQDEDSPMEDDDKIEDPELNEDSIDDLSNMDRWEPPAPPGHKGAPLGPKGAPPIPGAGKKKRNCQWSSWGRWSKCSKSCGRGVRQRTRRMASRAKNGGKRCSGRSRATKSCTERRTCPGRKRCNDRFGRRCGLYARRNYCNSRYKKWMRRNCRKSCKICSGAVSRPSRQCRDNRRD